MKSIARTTGTLCLMAALTACSSVTTISSNHDHTELSLKHTTPVVPSTLTLKDTSFGNYEFKAVAPGSEPFYGILPLRFHGGRLAMDILFFAPATMFNLRGVFPFYDLDVEKGVVRYKMKAGDPWTEYRPSAPERERARQFYDPTAG